MEIEQVGYVKYIVEAGIRHMPRGGMLDARRRFLALGKGAGAWGKA